jgi:DNA helicase-2/ATP-dependent DNA helicase PcrA
MPLITCTDLYKIDVVARGVATLLKNGLTLRNIVTPTYADKAAAAFKELIITRCGEQLGEMHGMAAIYVGTNSAFCLALLKNEVPKDLTYDMRYEVRQSLFLERCSTQHGLTTWLDLPRRPLHRYKDTQQYPSTICILQEADIYDKALKHCSIVAGLYDDRALLDDTRYFDFSPS